MRKLHIGCGRVYLPRENGWINHDLFSSVNADVYADMANLPFERGYFDLIYASHVLEHSQRNTVLAVLGHWRSLLCEGGVLRLAVPDFHAVCRRYLETGNLNEVMGLIYGGQNHPKNFHTVAFDGTSLDQSLRRVGFKEVRLWDWRNTEHADYDDYSQCFLPHMDKENGRLMSLNLEATK